MKTDWIKKIFEDEKGIPSWYRVSAFIALIPSLFCLVWSIVTVNSEGLLASSSIIIAILGLKVGQKKIENTSN